MAAAGHVIACADLKIELPRAKCDRFRDSGDLQVNERADLSTCRSPFLRAGDASLFRLA